MKKLNQSGFSPIILITLILVLALAISYIIYLSFGPKRPVVNPSPPPQAITTPQPSGSPADEGCFEDDFGGCDTEAEGDDPVFQ